MKLTIKELSKIRNGLLDLDGLQKPSPQEGGAPIFVPHKYSGKFTLRRVKLLNIVNAAFKEFEDAVEKLRKQHNPDGLAELDAEKTAAFDVEAKELQAEQIEVELRQFKIADLNLYDPEKNPKGNVLASAIIERVLPLIEDEVDPVEKKPAEDAQ